ncbi:MAG: PTS sugar transporter subunit IIA [Isosphaeraceae bacterium]
MADDAPEITAAILGTSNRVDSVDSLLAHMVEEGLLSLEDVSGVRDAIERRLTLGPVAIGGGVAIPHCKHPGTDRPIMAVALLRHPNTDWESLDGEPVDLVFLIVTPKEPAARSCTRFFERLMCRLRDGLGERLRRSTSPAELVEVVNGSEPN